jgi:hypothetical protein
MDPVQVEASMKIGTFSALFGGGLLVVLWGAGIKEADILIIALLILIHFVSRLAIYCICYHEGNICYLKWPNFLF